MPNTFYCRESILTTSQNKNANNDENNYDTDVCAKKTKDIRLGHDNYFDCHKKDSQNVSD